MLLKFVKGAHNSFRSASFFSPSSFFVAKSNEHHIFVNFLLSFVNFTSSFVWQVPAYWLNWSNHLIFNIKIHLQIRKLKLLALQKYVENKKLKSHHMLFRYQFLFFTALFFAYFFEIRFFFQLLFLSLSLSPRFWQSLLFSRTLVSEDESTNIFCCCWDTKKTDMVIENATTVSRLLTFNQGSICKSIHCKFNNVYHLNKSSHTIQTKRAYRRWWNCWENFSWNCF